MSGITSEALESTVLGVLEEACFLFAGPVEDDELVWPEEVIEASLPFHDGSSGRFLLVVPEELAVMLAANLLGIDEDDQKAAAESLDAVGELLNIIAGAAMENFFGRDQTHHLGTPSVTRLSSADSALALTDKATVVDFQVDDAYLLRAAVVLGDVE